MEEVTETKDRQRELIERYAVLRAKKSDLEARLAEINCELSGSEENPGGLTAEIATFMQDSSLKTIKFDDLGSVTLLAPTPRPKYEKENEQDVFDFVSKNGGNGLIKPTIHPSSFTSFIKELLEKGENLPEYIKVFYQPALRYLKPKQ